MDNTIEVRDPVKGYGDFLVVNHINFEAPQSKALTKPDLVGDNRLLKSYTLINNQIEDNQRR